MLLQKIMIKTLTIFTPAYNRGYLLPRLYEHLCAQTHQDFEWLVIDDGSTDNTTLLLDRLQAEGRISMRYVVQNNQGMHGAHNTAYANIHTTLNMCIDSDDYLPNNAVELILSTWQHMDQKAYAGIVGLDADTSGQLIGTKFNTEACTLEDFYAQGGKGDKKMVYRTDVVKQYPAYPLFEGERYVGLAYLYLRIDKDYKLKTLNEVLVIVDYQTDGSSNNMLKQYVRNPNGFLFYRTAMLQYGAYTRIQFRHAIHYVSSAIQLHQWHKIWQSPKPLLTVLALPFGLALRLYIKFKTRAL